MRLLIKKSLEYFIFSNLLVSLSAGTLCFGICSQINIPNKIGYGIFVFFSTLFTYNLQRLIKSYQIVSLPTNHIQWVLMNRKVLRIFLVLSCILMVYSFYSIFNWRVNSFLILFFSVTISLLYAFKIKGKSLRDLPHLKIHFIAIIWISAIGIFELVNENNYILNNWIFVLAHYFYILAITIPFDIRDLKYDKKSQRTIPQVFGVNLAKVISLISMLIYIIFVFIFKSTNEYNIFFILTIFATILLILGVNKSRNEFYFSGLIEGIIFILGLSYWI